MEKLLEQLENNDYALRTLERRMNDINEGNWAYGFYDMEKRIELYNHTIEVKRRVLRMRYRILENMQSITQKKMQYASSEMRGLLTKKVA